MSDNVTTHDKTYNGWSNYETWCVNLWWSNCEATCDIMDDFAKECIQSALEESDCENDDLNEVKQIATYKLSELMEQFIQDAYLEQIEQASGLFYDLLTSAIANVNFTEIAKQGVAYHWEEVYEDYRDNNS